MKTLIIDLTKNPPVIDSYAGEIGENNAVTLEIHTEDYEDVSKYVMLFEVDGGILPSAIFPAADVIEIPLVEALTQKQILTCQLQGMSEDGKSVITKSPIVRLYLDESLTGEIVPDPETGETIFSEIEKIKAILDSMDLSNYYNKDDVNTLLEGKQDILTEANAGENITIENGVISATGGSDVKEPFYATYDVTTNAEIKQAIMDGKKVYMIYDTGKTAIRYTILNYIGHNKTTDPYDVRADVNSYIFKFAGTISVNNVFTTFYAQVAASKSSSYSSDIVLRDSVVEFNEDGEYKESDILSAYGVTDAIDFEIKKALEEFRKTL